MADIIISNVLSDYVIISTVNGGVNILPPWILSSGKWNDSGAWYDSENWNDGV